ncbi:DNA recombination protein RmuC [Helicobacter kayseriensis]|uniref:DNA recombination protein RmuC n=1 Tax=Helicobacter kayseriensis TaxID=2905877 RepID=UPI001E5B6A3A|nr:DNA recombination protein RmuC [Helicobacter kayseriensis]MCE3046474.1 DNA recombination protein RmuC [Helicobacter kayseriensis]MCE3048223.1 DNA recombination protein RmuC [Helicobacter kayseriensis]
MNLILIISMIFLSSIIFLLLWKKQKHLQSLQALQEKINLLSLELSQKTQALLEAKQDFALQKEQLKNDYNHNLQKLEEKYALNLSSLEQRFNSQIKLHTETLLVQNKNLINEDSKKLLDEIFSPLKEQVKGYSERLVKNEERIQTSLKYMFEYTQSVENNAEKLTQILKGDKKIRGNFGEIQLKTLLQNSGLIEGEQYKLQENLRIDGSRYIPDAIIYLEKNKNIIIDSKFSLPSDFDLQNNTPLLCAQLASNLKNRIDELSKKPYKEFDSNTYDFVLLFIPYQNLLDLALESDPFLYQYAYNKKIYLTTPHTLFMALKTIHITWIDIKRNENAQKAFEEIGKFYDKFLGVLQDFENLQKIIERLNQTKDLLNNKLISGQGNLSSRFEKLQELGAKSKKSPEKQLKMS